MLVIHQTWVFLAILAIKLKENFIITVILSKNVSWVFVVDTPFLPWIVQNLKCNKVVIFNILWFILILLKLCKCLNIEDYFMFPLQTGDIVFVFLSMSVCQSITKVCAGNSSYILNENFPKLTLHTCSICSDLRNDKIVGLFHDRVFLSN